MSDDKRFTQWLQDYEAERMPDDMNIWNAIESQLTPPRRKVVVSRVGWLVAILILVMMTAGVYALDQIINNQIGDSGMQAVTEQGKVAELFITNDFGGEYELQITLDTIYADSNRVFVTLSAVGTTLATDPIELYLNPRVILENGDELPFLGFGGGGGGGGGGSSDTERMAFGSSLVTNLDASPIEITGDTLSLQILVEIAYSRANDPLAPRERFILGVTEYNVIVPFNHGISLTPNQTVTTGNIEMRLQSVVIAPSLTRLELCYIEPEHPEGDTSMSVDRWLPVMSLAVDNITIIESQLVGRLPDDYDAETGCYIYNLTYALDGYVGEWALSVDKLVYQLTPSQDELQQAFDDAGLAIETIAGGGYHYIMPPTEEDQGTLYSAIQAIYAQWQRTIDGAWTFTFTVPEA